MMLRDLMKVNFYEAVVIFYDGDSCILEWFTFEELKNLEPDLKFFDGEVFKIDSKDDDAEIRIHVKANESMFE